MSEKTKKDWKKFKEENAAQDELEKMVDVAESEALETNGDALDHPSYPDLEEKLTLAEQKSHENWESRPSTGCNRARRQQCCRAGASPSTPRAISAPYLTRAATCPVTWCG